MSRSLTKKRWKKGISFINPGAERPVVITFLKLFGYFLTCMYAPETFTRARFACKHACIFGIHACMSNNHACTPNVHT
jgi:hypothetical protein